MDGAVCRNAAWGSGCVSQRRFVFEAFGRSRGVPAMASLRGNVDLVEAIAVTEISLGTCPSPLGTLLLASAGDQLVSLDYENFHDRYDRLLQRRFPNCRARNAPAPRMIRE